MFRHHDIANDYEAITLASLLQNREEGIAAARGAQKRQSPVARGSDKVQVVSAIGAMQAAGHSKSHNIGSSYPPLQKAQERGTRCSGTGRENTESPGHPPSASE
jgi:hypothetical protein